MPSLAPVKLRRAGEAFLRIEPEARHRSTFRPTRIVVTEPVLAQCKDSRRRNMPVFHSITAPQWACPTADLGKVGFGSSRYGRRLRFPLARLSA